MIRPEVHGRPIMKLADEQQWREFTAILEKEPAWWADHMLEETADLLAYEEFRLADRNGTLTACGLASLLVMAVTLYRLSLSPLESPMWDIASVIFFFVALVAIVALRVQGAFDRRRVTAASKFIRDIRERRRG